MAVPGIISDKSEKGVIMECINFNLGKATGNKNGKIILFELNQVFLYFTSIDRLHIEKVITNLCPNECV